MAALNIPIQIKRGLKAALPAEGLAGELYLCTDTNELYRGAGTGNALEQIAIDKSVVLGLLDGNGKIQSSLLPALAISEVYVVADIAARDALTVQSGDVAVVLDATADVGSAVRISYIYDGSAWQRINSVDAVTSVNGQSGDVSLDSDDIAEGITNLYFTTARAQAVIDADATLVRGGDDATRLTGPNNSATGLFAKNTDGTTFWADGIDAGTF